MQLLSDALLVSFGGGSRKTFAEFCDLLFAGATAANLGRAAMSGHE
jgi:hypothetical protein